MPELTFSLPRFNDMHIHCRQGDTMVVVDYSATYCDRMLVMPNTVPPIATGVQARQYRDQLCDYVSRRHATNIEQRILLTIKLMEYTTPQNISDAKALGITAAKLYPANATTNSHDGVRDVRALAPVFDAMQQQDLVLCLHGELPDSHPEATVLDWERNFVGHHLTWLYRNFPKLRIVLEHITTAFAVQQVLAAPDTVVATITPHHLLITLDDILADGLRPSNYCKPVAKLPRDRTALGSVVIQDHPKFLLGSDSAPHRGVHKYQECGCAGCFTAPLLPSLVMEIRSRLGISHSMSNYLSRNAANFYGFEWAGGSIPMIRDPWEVNDSVYLKLGDLTVRFPLFWSGRRLDWRMVGYMPPGVNCANVECSDGVTVS